MWIPFMGCIILHRIWEFRVLRMVVFGLLEFRVALRDLFAFPSGCHKP